MFSLIFAIIAIGLVVALAASTMYYLAVSSDKHAKEAAAAGLLTQGEQIVAAIDMRSVSAEGELTNLQQLVARNYLSSLPTPAAGTYAEGLVAKDSDWWLLAPGMLPAVMLQNKLDIQTCLAVNRKLGLDGIKATPDATRRIQCFGAAAPYTLVLNPSAKPEVLGSAVDTWNKCVADPTSPGCTSPTAPEPFCVANPTDAACTTSPSTSLCVADPTNALCVPSPDPGKSFCELNPADAHCTTSDGSSPPQPTCVIDPTNALCLVPPDATPFCELNPAHTACTTLTPTPLCVTDPTHPYCTTTPPPGGGGGSYCKAPLGCTYCWMSNPTTGSCLTTPIGTEPALPFSLPTGANPVPTPEPDGGAVICRQIAVSDCHQRSATGVCEKYDSMFVDTILTVGNMTYISYNAIVAVNGVEYDCRHSTTAPTGTLPVCTLDIAIETVYARPELRTNPVIAAWFETDPGWLLWSAELGWYAEYDDNGTTVRASYADFAAFKTEVIDYTTAPYNLLSSLPSDVCVPVFLPKPPQPKLDFGPIPANIICWQGPDGWSGTSTDAGVVLPSMAGADSWFSVLMDTARFESTLKVQGGPAEQLAGYMVGSEGRLLNPAAVAYNLAPQGPMLGVVELTVTYASAVRIYVWGGTLAGFFGTSPATALQLTIKDNTGYFADTTLTVYCDGTNEVLTPPDIYGTGGGLTSTGKASVN